MYSCLFVLSPGILRVTASLTHIKKKAYAFFFAFVLSPGIEPRSPVPQTGVLSVELQERATSIYKKTGFVNQFSVFARFFGPVR